MSTVFVGDVGTEIILDCGIDITTATVCKIYVQVGLTDKRVWDAFPHNTTCVRHIVQAGELDKAGTWALQAYVEMPGFKGKGKPVTLNVVA